jgi:dihydroceramidase
LEGDVNMMQDYYATTYAAEIVNTMTNMLFLWLGIKGVRNCLREGHDKIFLISFLGYLVVGTGSLLFHATLKCMILSSFICALFSANSFSRPHAAH